uniref:Protein LYRIC n=1 Tax=Electrophorus electricus TaxID=8005 RepID=A0A4W4G140_ELEEL
MMATSWQAVSVEQAEVMATRLRQLASSGLHFLNNEFGIDLGLKPELYPSWVILSTALFGMIAAVALSWVAACHGVGRRKRGAVVSESGASVTDIAKAPLKKSVKSEEPKKKNKKKPADKVVQPPFIHFSEFEPMLTFER